MHNAYILLVWYRCTFKQERDCYVAKQITLVTSLPEMTVKQSRLYWISLNVQRSKVPSKVQNLEPFNGTRCRFHISTKFPKDTFFPIYLNRYRFVQEPFFSHCLASHWIQTPLCAVRLKQTLPNIRLLRSKNRSQIAIAHKIYETEFRQN